jgi:hypothetical protein
VIVTIFIEFFGGIFAFAALAYLIVRDKRR